ncbi:low temperature requirement protein A [Saccharopolyspora sp. K220]|uniref:low temperature requirement protein A n=1 Tax=Saccharopolyspora soli TaxID=2926618 RepID=UPI001F59263C|nr:low temperature requirement protein A [Saccharopolyspora soli]MCI2415791.1 low temperature requirement protein A [Saccharopolyspora soli]
MSGPTSNVEPREPEPTEGVERHAGWLELFYDLLFVVLVAQLAHPLVDHPTWQSGLGLLVLFLPAWWVWVGSTLYTNLTGEIGAERRIDVLVQMAILLVMAGAATPAAHGHPAVFAGAYAASRLAVLAFRLAVRGKWPAGGANWPLLLSAALWAGSIALAPPATYLLWLAALAVEIAPWLLGTRSGSPLRRRLVSGGVEISHLVERFGLFMIIVLGESIAQIVAAIADADAAPPAVITGLAAFAVVAMLWWLYFDFGSAVAERTMSARREDAFRLTRSIFLIGHFLPVVSLVAFAAGLGGLVAAATSGQHAGGALRLCVAALAIYMLNNGFIGLRVMRYAPGRVFPWLLPNLVLFLVLAWLADRLVPAVALILIASFLTIETLPAIKHRRTPT